MIGNPAVEKWPPGTCWMFELDSACLRVFCSEDGGWTWNHGLTPFLAEICSASCLVSTGRFGGNGWPWSFFMLLVSSVDPGFWMFEVFLKTGALPEDCSHIEGFWQYFEIFSTNTRTLPCHSRSFAQVFLSHRAPFLPGCRPFDSLMLKKGVTVRVSQTKNVFSVLCVCFWRMLSSNSSEVSRQNVFLSLEAFIWWGDSFCLVHSVWVGRDW